MRTHYDAIIIGAGPAGSSAAIMLARAGWRIALVEKREFPRRKVCGECIAASNLPLLEALGIGDDFFALAGPPLRRVALMSGAHILRADFPPFDHPRHRWGVALGRDHLDTLLLEQARRCGVTVFQPWTVLAVEGEPGNFRCALARVHADEGATLAAPVLIGAHGSWEIAPTEGRKPRPLQRPSDLFAFKANFTQTHLQPGLLPVLAFPGGYGGMVIGDHGRTTFAFCIRRDRLAESRSRMTEHKAAEAAAVYVTQQCKGVGDALKDAERQDAWLSVGPIRPGIRMPKNGGSLFLIGNAAGEAHPIIGEGMSMAIQSAWLLAGTLAPHRIRCAGNSFQLALHRDYAQAWRRHFALRIRLAACFAHAAMRPALMNAALPLLKSYPSLLTRAARWSGKIRGAPLQETDAHRLPDINNRPA